MISQVELPKVIQAVYPDLSNEETEQVRQGVMTQMSLSASGGLVSEKERPENAQFIDGQGNPTEPPDRQPGQTGDAEDSEQPAGSRQFLKLSGRAQIGPARALRAGRAGDR